MTEGQLLANTHPPDEPHEEVAVCEVLEEGLDGFQGVDEAAHDVAVGGHVGMQVAVLHHDLRREKE